jgi:hypothetical protein
MTTIKATLNSVLDLVKGSTAPRAPVTEDDNVYVTKADLKVAEAVKAQQQVEYEQRANFQRALEMFPELKQDSDNFDKEFYDLADSHFRYSLNKNDPEAPLKAAKLAAVELNKIERLAKAKVLTDDARRNRILSEGGSRESANSVKDNTGSQMNDNRLKKLLKVDPDSIRALMKANPERYSKKKD